MTFRSSVAALAATIKTTRGVRHQRGRRAGRTKATRASPLRLQFGVFGASLLENGNIRIGVLPEGKEILVGFARARFIAGKSAGASKAQMRQGADRFVNHHAGVIENFLEFRRGLRALVRGEIRQTAQVCRIQSEIDRFRRRAEVVRRGGLKRGDGLGGIFLGECDGGLDFRQILWIARSCLAETVG